MRLAPDDIRDIRQRLGWTQVGMGRMLNVHSITVSKWERNEVDLPLYHECLLRAFSDAAKLDDKVGRETLVALASGGIVAALRRILLVEQVND